VPRLSIIIPVVGDSQQLDDTLVSVLENRPVNCEILVVHNRPYHDPYNLSDEVRFVEAECGAGMVECLNRGLAACRSPVVQVLACGVEVLPGWADAALRHFSDPAIAAVGGIVVDRDDRRKIVSAGWGYRVEGTAWRLGQQNEPDKVTAVQRDLCGPDALAAFYRTSAIQAVGGFSSWTGDALAGIDLALALRQAGFHCVLEPQFTAYAAATATRRESAFRCGRHAERLFWRWAPSHGWLSSLVGHMALLAGQCVISLWRPSMPVQLVGRVCGTLDAMFAERRPTIEEADFTRTPSVGGVAAPHFATARLHKEQHSSRVA
jgi:GT2 family glycosyltransferase